MNGWAASLRETSLAARKSPVPVEVEAVKSAPQVGAAMARRQASGQVLHLTGPVTLDWGNGMRLTLSPASMAGVPSPAAEPRGRPGRKPSSATQALVAAMQADGSRPRARADYLAVLRDAGHKGSDNSAALIINREAKRIFGAPLGRSRKGKKKAGNGKGGRQASPATVLLREKLAHDKAASALRDAPHYLRWVVDQPGVKLGLKQARPIVYRELKLVR